MYSIDVGSHLRRTFGNVKDDRGSEFYENDIAPDQSIAGHHLTYGIP
jgi:hypothetical protein